MSIEKLRLFIKNNSFWITFIPLFIGMHWGWLKLQDNPKLVDPQHKKELPIVGVRKKISFLICRSLFI